MLTKLIYYFLILPLSYLPHFVLYRLSDAMYIIVYYIVRYRMDIVTDNLISCFPDKTSKEINKLKKEYYAHLCDLIFESIKNFSISKEEIKKRFTFEKTPLLDDLHNEGKSYITIGGHYGSWERYALAVGDISLHQQMAIYRPLKNKFLNNKIKSSRERFDLMMIPMSSTKKHFCSNSEKLKSITFGSDQWPSNTKRSYWTTFLGKETAFYSAAENFAKTYDWAVVYCSMVKVKRGYYHASYQLITKEPNETAEFEIMESFVRKMESSILHNPAYWLWSHRRWKKTKEETLKHRTKS